MPPDVSTAAYFPADAFDLFRRPPKRRFLGAAHGQPMMPSAPCPICGGNPSPLLMDYLGDTEAFRHLRLVQCTCCALVYAIPPPPADVLEAYNASYFAHAHGGTENHPDSVRFSTAIARIRLAHIERYASDRQVAVGSVVEIGPGHGYFHQQLKDRYRNIEYLAVESDASCRALLQKNGAKAFAGFDLIPPPYHARFDLAVASHVLEHTADPVSFVRGIAALLKPGGLIFVEVPCRDFEFKARHEPHLVFFDKQSLSILLQKIGFEDIEVSYHGKSIKEIRAGAALAARIWARISRLAHRFLPTAPDLRVIEDRAEREVVAPFKAHLTRTEPSWWLRGVARLPAR